MRVLLTGATSFVGRHILPLLSATHDVIAHRHLSQVGGKGADRAETPAQWVQGDLSRKDSYDVFPSEVDAIVHLAAGSSPEKYSAPELVAINVVGMRNLLQYAKCSEAKYFIFASTLSVYGEITDSVVTETTPICRPDAYGLTKYIGEVLLAEACDRMAGLSLRLPGIVGPGAHRNWLSGVLRDVRSGADVAIYSPDAAFNNVIHVADLSRYVTGLLEDGWDGYAAMPLGADGAITVRDVVQHLIAAAGSNSKIVEKPPRRSPFTISSRRAQTQFGYTPRPVVEILQKFAHEG